MRTFTFDVLQMVTADGYSRITEGSRWLRLAQKMHRDGAATLVLDSKIFAGYGGSTDIGYTRYTYTVTEVLD